MLILKFVGECIAFVAAVVSLVAVILTSTKRGKKDGSAVYISSRPLKIHARKREKMSVTLEIDTYVSYCKNVAIRMSELTSTLEEVWEVIRMNHDSVPGVVVSVGQANGRSVGNLCGASWRDRRSHTLTPELFIAGEHLRDGAQEVMTTLLHEAAHGIALTEGAQDTTRQGRYHNSHYREFAELVGLQACQTQQWGWSSLLMPPETISLYSQQIERLNAAISAYREPTVNLRRSSNNNGVSCQCKCGRVIRVSASVCRSGPIVCGQCRSPFAPKVNGNRTEEQT